MRGQIWLWAIRKAKWSWPGRPSDQSQRTWMDSFPDFMPVIGHLPDSHTHSVMQEQQKMYPEVFRTALLRGLLPQMPHSLPLFYWMGLSMWGCRAWVWAGRVAAKKKAAILWEMRRRKRPGVLRSSRMGYLESGWESRYWVAVRVTQYWRLQNRLSGKIRQRNLSTICTMLAAAYRSGNTLTSSLRRHPRPPSASSLHCRNSSSSFLSKWGTTTHTQTDTRAETLVVALCLCSPQKFSAQSACLVSRKQESWMSLRRTARSGEQQRRGMSVGWEERKELRAYSMPDLMQLSRISTSMYSQKWILFSRTMLSIPVSLNLQSFPHHKQQNHENNNTVPQISC